MTSERINWFPGHMKKAIDEINKQIKNVDFIIEVLDARAPTLTSNNELKKLFNQKPIIKVALKSDLSDIQHNYKNDEIIFGTIKSKTFRKAIILKLEQVFETKIKNLKAKNLSNPNFIGMVVGLPNVGKSSLINHLSLSNKLKVENRSGVTKRQSITKINNNFFLIDTPGIFFKKIDNLNDGIKLVILNNVKREVVNIEIVLKLAYEYFLTNYPLPLKKFYQMNETLSFNQFIKFICEKYKFKDGNNEYDLNRAYQFILDNFSNGLICKFHFI